MPYSKSSKSRKMGWLLLLPFVLLAVLLAALLIRFQGASAQKKESTSESLSLLTSRSSDSSESSSSSHPEPEPAPTLVPQGEEVPPIYFQDVVFVGDSLTDGLRLYGVPELLPQENVIAYTGINPDTINYSKVLTNKLGQPCTFLEKLIEMQPDCLYYMNGTNGVGWLDNEVLVELNRSFLTEVKKALPNCKVYVQSIFPFTASLCAADPTYSNDLVREYNQLMYQMAQEMGFYFVNCYEAFADENGNLPEEASAEGIHFGPTYYGKWVDYLTCHTILDQEEREVLEQRQKRWEEEGGTIPSRPQDQSSSYTQSLPQPQQPDSSEEEPQSWPPENPDWSDSFSEEPEEKPPGTL